MLPSTLELHQALQQLAAWQAKQLLDRRRLPSNHLGLPASCVAHQLVPLAA